MATSPVTSLADLVAQVQTIGQAVSALSQVVQKQSAPAAPAAPAASNGTKTIGKGGKTLHSAPVSKPAPAPASKGKLAPPPATSPARKTDDFDPRRYYQLDPGSILPLNTDGSMYLGISTAEKYWGNVILVGVKRRAMSFNPRTLAVLAGLNWAKMVEHASDLLPEDIFAEADNS